MCVFFYMCYMGKVTWQKNTHCSFTYDTIRIQSWLRGSEFVL